MRLKRKCSALIALLLILAGCVLRFAMPGHDYLGYLLWGVAVLVFLFPRLPRVGRTVLGVLVVLGLRALIGDDIANVTWRRWLRMAVVALPVIVVSDAVVTWFKLAGGPLLSTITGWLILARWVALAIVAAALAITRERGFDAVTIEAVAAAARRTGKAATTQAAERPPDGLAERLGATPKNRLYSRLNWEGLA